MKRAILTGAVAFLLGAASSPRAANDNETLTLLCKRFEAAGGKARIHEIRDVISKIRIEQMPFNAEANSLEILQRTICR